MTGTNIAEVLKAKGFDLSKVQTVEPKVIELDARIPMILFEIQVKTPRFFNEATARWMCPDHTTGITICSSNKQNKECKPNCTGCVLRRSF